MTSLPPAMCSARRLAMWPSKMRSGGALPGIRSHLDAAAPVWNATVFNVLLVEALVLVLAVLLPQLTVARRRDFL